MSSSSSRTREWNDSTNGFCHGEPGSMYAVAVCENRHQSLERVSGQLWTVVHSDVLRRAALGGQALQHADGPVSVDAALHQHR